MSTQNQQKKKSYLVNLERKEKKIIGSFLKRNIKHRHISVLLRVIKGILLGFGFANIFILRNIIIKTSTSLIVLLISIILAFTLIHFEKRTYNRKGLRTTLDSFIYLLLTSIVISTFVLAYAQFNDFIITVSLTLLMTSFSYSQE